MKSNKFKLILMSAVLLLFIGSCHTDRVVDTNESLPQRNWSYVKKIKATVEVKDPAVAYNLHFKLRITDDYRYSNIYILMHLKGQDQFKSSKRYTYRLAAKDGRWYGKGSGNLYTFQLPLLTGYHFPKAGNYTVEIEQNMRDNPLKEISDAGISVIPL